MTTERRRYRYIIDETETPPTRATAGRLVAVGLGLLILVGSAMAWAAQPPQTPTQGAVSASVSESDIKHEFVQSWVWLEPLRYPCPKGQRRMYREVSPHIWRADCEVTP